MDYWKRQRYLSAQRQGLITPFERGGESGFMKVLHGLQTPLYVTAGLVEEYVNRQKGFAPTSYADILRESGANLIPWVSDIKRRTTYGNMVDNKALAFGLDVFGDPTTYIPATWFTKIGKGGLMLTKLGIGKPMGLTLKGIDKATGFKTFDFFKDTNRAIRKAFIAESDLARVGGEELVNLKRKYYNEVDVTALREGEKVMKQLEAIVPDARRREHLFGLLERRPVLTPGQRWSNIARTDDFMRWRQEMRGLSPQERIFYEQGVKIQDELEELKIAAHLITREQAAGLVYKMGGTGYMPHQMGRRSVVLEQMDEALKRLDAGGKEADAIKARVGAKDRKATIDWIKRERKEIEMMGEMFDSALIERIRKSTSFARTRKVTTPGEELKALGIEINLDAAQVLGVERAQVAKATASMRHVQAMADYMKKKGLMFDEIPDAATLKSRLGKQAENLSGDFVSADEWGIKALKGKYIPRELSDEIRSVMDKYKNPKFIEGFLKKYAKVQNIWKAWTLSIFPAYHSRNAISNLWNNFLAGMGPTATDNYRQAMKLLWKRSRGTLNNAEERIINEAVDHRVIGTGLMKGELDEIMTKRMDRLTGLGKATQYVFNPAYNPFVKAGFKSGTAIENHARLAHYLWARSKGLDPMDASGSVMKYLFDYKHGITPFEKKMFRDFMMPFYTWTRFNLPLQLEMLATRPGRFVTLPKMMRGFEEISEQLRDDYGAPDVNEFYMADWMKRATKVRLKYNREKESYEYFFLDNWIPSAELNRIMDVQAFRDMMTGLMSPFTKLPIEVAFNYNLFQKKPLKRYKGEKKKLLGFDVDPKWIEHPARTIRLINEADKLYEAHLTDSGQVSKLAAWVRVGVGRTYPYRPEKQQKWWEYQIKRRISELKQIRRYADEREWVNQVGVLDGLVEELEAEKKFFKELDLSSLRY